MRKAGTVLFVIGIGAALALMQSRSESQGEAAGFKVDSVHSSAIFRIKHLGIGNIYGRFNEISGTLDYASGGEGSAVDLTIRAASLDTNNQKRDNHLRSADFFSVKEFPTITFKSTKWKKTGDNAYEVTGNLSLHGNTKTITVKVEKTGEGDRGRQGYRVGFETTFDIKRSDFGMKKLLKPAGDDVRLIISVEAIRN